MAFELPPLPYAYEALEAAIDKKTMELHHDKHHGAYVSNLNAALEKYPEWQDKTVEEICREIAKVPQDVRTAVRNQGGGHYNHSIFWQMMKKNGGGEPSAELAKAIDKKFGSFSAFKDQFTKAALGQFGSASMVDLQSWISFRFHTIQLLARSPCKNTMVVVQCTRRESASRTFCGFPGRILFRRKVKLR